MFVEVIRGQVADPEQVHAALDWWSQRPVRRAGSAQPLAQPGTAVRRAGPL
jgi:hypothetical protein